jgi:hypothetical protein
MTQFDLSNQSEILHNCIKSKTVHESSDRINNLENSQNFDILKNVWKIIFLIVENEIRNSLYMCNIQDTGFFRSVVFKK